MAAALYALHQDFWFWREARPLVFGFLPIGLFYHAAYTIATSALMFVLVRSYWHRTSMIARANDPGDEPVALEPDAVQLVEPPRL